MPLNFQFALHSGIHHMIKSAAANDARLISHRWRRGTDCRGDILRAILLGGHSVGRAGKGRKRFISYSMAW